MKLLAKLGEAIIEIGKAITEAIEGWIARTDPPGFIRDGECVFCHGKGEHAEDCVWMKIRQARGLSVEIDDWDDCSPE